WPSSRPARWSCAWSRSAWPTRSRRRWSACTGSRTTGGGRGARRPPAWAGPPARGGGSPTRANRRPTPDAPRPPAPPGEGAAGPGGPGLVAVTVRDRGPGVAPEVRERLFQRFVHGPPQEGEAQATGTGLGLAIVRGLVEAHAGSVTLEEPDGPGAAFRFT